MNRVEYEQLVVESIPKISSYFSRRSGDPDEIADLTQESIAAILESRHRFRDLSSFATWMYSICRNVYRKHAYYAERRRKIETMLKSDYASSQDLHAKEEDDLTRRSIRSLIETLDYADRRLFLFYYIEKRPIREISEILEISVGTMKWLLFRLRKRIKTKLLSPG